MKKKKKEKDAPFFSISYSREARRGKENVGKVTRKRKPLMLP